MFKVNARGYLSIYLSLTLVVMLSLCLTLIDGARRSGIRLESECAVDIGLTSVMAEYHRELFQQYNLFYIDSSYGTSVPTYCNTQARLQYYIEENLTGGNKEHFDFVYKDFLDLKLGDVYIETIALATDDDGKRFQKNAAQAMLDEVGAGLAEDVLEWVGVVERKSLTEYDLEKERKKVNQDIEEMLSEKRKEDEEKWISVEIPNPLKYIEEFVAKGILQSILGGDKISSQTIDLSPYILARKRRGQLRRGNAVCTDEVSAVEKVLFHEYIMRHAGFWGQENEGSLLKYQVEYVLGGTESDATNLAKTLTRLFQIRGAANIIYLYGDKGKMNVVNATSHVITALVPEFEGIVSAALVLGWAYVESLYDLKVLMAGGRIPLLKKEEDWHYDLDSILESVDMEVKDKSSKGLDYKDYLHILLFLSDGETIAFRFMDLVEMEIRRTKGNENFRMDGCIEWLEVTAVFCSGSGYKHRVRAQMGYE